MKGLLDTYLMKMSETMALRLPRMFSQVLWTSRIWWPDNLVWGSTKSSEFLYQVNYNNITLKGFCCSTQKE